MHFSSNGEWQAALREVAIFVTAIVIGLLGHYLSYRLAHRLAARRKSLAAAGIAERTSGPVRLLLLLCAIAIVLPHLTISNPLLATLKHALEIVAIVAVAWLAVAAIEIFNALVNYRLPDNMQDDVRARRKRTQVQLLRQIVTGFIVFSAVAAVMMTFPSVRSIGANLLASAGLAGLVLGMAARPALGNLIAGIQIALTEPIRIDDAVVVEGEFGRVAEVNTAYVVVRLWDLRHLIVPLSYFIEKPFQNWTRYSSDLIGAVLLHTDYSVPMDRLREEYHSILTASPLWDGRVTAVQVTDAKPQTLELRFLMSAANPSAAFDLRCHVRERLIDYLQKNHPDALPRVRADVAMTS
jgi:small-conductance mechanosensitive channel